MSAHKDPCGIAAIPGDVPMHPADGSGHIANQLVKLKHAYCEDMPFDVIPDWEFDPKKFEDRNVLLYERHGFDVVEELILPKTDVHGWLMLRAPAASPRD